MPRPVSFRQFLLIETSWKIVLLLLIIISVFLGWLGPFGTYEVLPLLPRLVYWFCSVFIGGIFATLSNRFIFWLSSPWAWHPLGCTFAGSLIGAIPVTFINSLLNHWYLSWSLSFEFHLTFMYFFALYAHIMPIVFAISVLFFYLITKTRRTPPLPPNLKRQDQDTSYPRLIKRLPHEKRGIIQALTMEDHYVRVHTDKGQHLILMRLRDAIAELDYLDGARIHRSYWVANTAVLHAYVHNNRWFLEVEGGLNLPVSRSYVKPLRKLGWIGKHKDKQAF